jgi:polygalacturonase
LAHSITEAGYENFDSSHAINKTIQYAVSNNISNVDFGSGSGKYYAKNIHLASNITYSSTQDAELIASPNITSWQSALMSWLDCDVETKIIA